MFISRGLTATDKNKRINLGIEGQNLSHQRLNCNRAGMNEDHNLSNNDLFRKLMDSIKCENEKNKQEIISHIGNENGKLLNALDQQSKRIHELEVKCDKLEEKCIALERKTRKNNIIIFGLDIGNSDNLASTVLNKLNYLLDIRLCESDLNNIFLLKNSSKPAIKIEFLSHMSKDTLFQNVQKLKGTKISVLQDMCHEDRIDNKILVKHMKEAKSRNISAKIKGYRLLMNGEQYTAEQLRKQEFESQDTTAGNVENSENRKQNSFSAPSTPEPTRKEISYTRDLDEDITNDNLNQSTKPQAKKTKKIITDVSDKTERRTRFNSASTSTTKK